MIINKVLISRLLSALGQIFIFNYSLVMILGTYFKDILLTIITLWRVTRHGACSKYFQDTSIWLSVLDTKVFNLRNRAFCLLVSLIFIYFTEETYTISLWVWETSIKFHNVDIYSFVGLKIIEIKSIIFNRIDSCTWTRCILTFLLWVTPY